MIVSAKCWYNNLNKCSIEIMRMLSRKRCNLTLTTNILHNTYHINKEFDLVKQLEDLKTIYGEKKL